MSAAFATSFATSSRSFAVDAAPADATPCADEVFPRTCDADAAPDTGPLGSSRERRMKGAARRWLGDLDSNQD